MKTTILTSFVAIALFAARRSFAVAVRSQVNFSGASLSFALSMFMPLICLASELSVNRSSRSGAFSSAAE